jgi:hypothetical protein
LLIHDYDISAAPLAEHLDGTVVEADGEHVAAAVQEVGSVVELDLSPARTWVPSNEPDVVDPSARRSSLKV